MTTDFFIGLAAGILIAVIAVAFAAYFFLRDSSPPLIPSLPAASDSPAVSVMMLESFLNQQLREALASEALELQDQSNQAAQPRAPFRIKLNDAALDVKPNRSAHFTAQLAASAWNLQVQVRPVTEFYFVPQDGRVKILVTRVQVRGFTVPHALIDKFVSEVVMAAEAKLNHSLAQLQHDTKVTLNEIESTEDLLILKFS